MKTLLVLGGPTASGKTNLAIEWALQHNTEIVSFDSRQCYKELNIGVAKPTEHELQKVPHHFINSHSIHEELSAGDYERYALDILHVLFKRHDVVIACGGTGLYIKALKEGIDEMPEIDEHIKAQVEQDYKQQGLLWLQGKIKMEDPEFYRQAEQHNPARLMRALIFKLSNKVSILRFKTKSKKQRPFGVKAFYIQLDRETLYTRINQRVITMMDSGLLGEAEQLVPLRKLKNLQTVGYQELFSYLDGDCTLAQAVDKIQQNTRHYAKRQMTWFGNQTDFKKIIY